MTRSDFSLGDEVLAPWMDDGYLYPGVIVKLFEDRARVAFLDGDDALVLIAELRRSVIGVGQPLEINWKGRGDYYRGVIRARIGSALEVDYADGTVGWSTLGQCRLSVGSLADQPPGRTACVYCGASMEASSERCPGCGSPRHLYN